MCSSSTVSAVQSPKRTDGRGCETPRLASSLAVVSPFVGLVQKVSCGLLASPPLFVYFEDFDQCILEICSKTYLTVSDTILVVFFFFVSANLLSDLDQSKQCGVKSEQFSFWSGPDKETRCCETTISACFFRTREFKNLLLLVVHVAKLHLVSRHSWMVG